MTSDPSSEPSSGPTPEPTRAPSSPERRSWFRRHRGGLWTTLAGVVTVITFVTGADNLPDLFTRESGRAPAEASPGGEDELPGPATPTEPVEVTATDKRGDTHTLLLTIVQTTQDAEGVYVSMSLGAADPTAETLHYLYQATNPETSETDRFQLIDATGRSFEQTGQLGIPTTERSRFELSCAPFTSEAAAPFVLEFRGAQLSGGATLVHLPDPRRFQYRECAGATVILPLFRIAVPAPVG